nr:hypothetical protein [Tanacetum cinerariifolium]
TGRYVVPTGRVVVPTGRYVVPTGRVVVPTGRSILTNSQVTLTKPKRMTNPYSSHRFITNYFNAEHLKMEVKGKKEKEKSENGLLAESFDWDDESISSNDEGSTKIRAFMAIAEDEPLVGKIGARSGQWVDITMKKGPVPKKTRPSIKMSPAHVVNKRTEKYPIIPKPYPNKKTDSSTEQLIFTLIKEVKGLKRQIKILTDTPSSSSQPSRYKACKQKTWFGPCKHCGFRNHLSDDCYSKLECSTCGSTDHLTKEHSKHAAIKKTLSKLKAQSPLKPSPKKAPMIPKPFIECKYCEFNDHHSDHCEFYPGCEVCGSIAHEASDCLKKHPNFRRPRIAN